VTETGGLWKNAAKENINIANSLQCSVGCFNYTQNDKPAQMTQCKLIHTTLEL